MCFGHVYGAYQTNEVIIKFSQEYGICSTCTIICRLHGVWSSSRRDKLMPRFYFITLYYSGTALQKIITVLVILVADAKLYIPSDPNMNNDDFFWKLCSAEPFAFWGVCLFLNFIVIRGNKLATHVTQPHYQISKFIVQKKHSPNHLVICIQLLIVF
jgi:hypothetical protein